MLLQLVKLFSKIISLKRKFLKSKYFFQDHFRKQQQVKVNLNSSPFKLPSAGPENCALMCLNDSSLNSNYYRCLSFDLCKNPDTSSASPFVCSFYNSSFVTDPSVILDTEPLCDHYSSKKSSPVYFPIFKFYLIFFFIENVLSIDGVLKEDAFRAIETSVIRKEFIIDFDLGDATLAFTPDDIYPATLDPSADSAGGIALGSSKLT